LENEGSMLVGKALANDISAIWLMIAQIDTTLFSKSGVAIATSYM